MKIEVINPVKRKKRNPRSTRVLRNPRWNLSAAVIAGGAVLLGIVGSRAIAKLVLGERDVGAIGYGGQLIAGLSLAAILRAFGGPFKRAAPLVGTGGVASVIWRGLADTGVAWAQPGTFAEYYRTGYLPGGTPYAQPAVAQPYSEYWRQAA